MEAPLVCGCSQRVLPGGGVPVVRRRGGTKCGEVEASWRRAGPVPVMSHPSFPPRAKRAPSNCASGWAASAFATQACCHRQPSSSLHCLQKAVHAGTLILLSVAKAGLRPFRRAQRSGPFGRRRSHRPRSPLCKSKPGQQSSVGSCGRSVISCRGGSTRSGPLESLVPLMLCFSLRLFRCPDGTVVEPPPSGRHWLAVHYVSLCSLHNHQETLSRMDQRSLDPAPPSSQKCKL